MPWRRFRESEAEQAIERTHKGVEGESMRVVIDASAIAEWYLKPEGMRLLQSEVLARVEAHVHSLMFIELGYFLRYARGLNSGDFVNGVRAASAHSSRLRGDPLSIVFESDLTV